MKYIILIIMAVCTWYVISTGQLKNVVKKTTTQVESIGQSATKTAKENM